MKIYLSACYRRQLEMQRTARELETFGHDITSRRISEESFVGEEHRQPRDTRLVPDADGGQIYDLSSDKLDARILVEHACLGHALELFQGDYVPLDLYCHLCHLLSAG